MKKTKRKSNIDAGNAEAKTAFTPRGEEAKPSIPCHSYKVFEVMDYKKEKGLRRGISFRSPSYNEVLQYLGTIKNPENHEFHIQFVSVYIPVGGGE